MLIAAVTGTLTGEEAFRRGRRFTGMDENTGIYVFESADADAGEFTYFCFAPDTPAETYHIEFRYGSDLDNLGHFDAGACAYWMAAGISVDCDSTMIENCIELFCAENLAG